ncbi:MAG: alpha/beta fold hydrolase [Desulfocapsaceae bacterium]|nr:alpha/beta fold hydrolase [Desulfocapsaceae bacterium]
MVHGNPTWSYYYRNLISLLAERYRVIAVDNMGCGLSDKPQKYPYRLQTHIDNLSSLLNYLEIERNSLIVHDWGGAIGMGYAVSFPERIAKIVILNTAAFRSSRIPLRIRICRWPLFGAMLVRGCNGFAAPASHMAVTKPLERKVAMAYLSPYDSWKNRVAIHAFVRDIPLSSDHPSYETLVRIENGLAGLADSLHPMLILWGAKDFCFNRYFYQEWCHRFPDAEHHYFVHGGHYILDDCLDEISPILLNFFQRKTGDSTAS